MKTFIRNRKGQRISILVEQPVTEPRGLVIVMHGLGGFKEQPQLQTIIDSFLSHGFTSVRFDTTNTFGESDGDYADATTTNYYEDLEDVISWAQTNMWYTQPFILVGHSIGGLCTLLFTEKYPEKVKAIAPLSTVISGELSARTKKASGELEQWKKTGWRITMSESKPGVEKRLKWSHMEDRMKYDILPQANKLTMPVLLVVGEDDDTTPLYQQQLLIEKLPGRKELHVIEGASHTFRGVEHLQKLRAIVDGWIRTI